MSWKEGTNEVKIGHKILSKIRAAPIGARLRMEIFSLRMLQNCGE